MTAFIRFVIFGAILASLVFARQKVAADGVDLSQYQMVERLGIQFYYQADLPVAALNELAAQSDTARRRIQQLSNDTMLYDVKVVLAPDDSAFARLAGPNAENTLAVAISGQRTVVINRLYQNKWPGVSFQSLLVHEWMHVYLDVKFPGDVPRWLHEGVAQMAAGETADRSSVAWARLVGGLIPLSDMHSGMPGGRDRMAFAYLQSLAVTEHLVRSRHNGSLTIFLEYLRSRGGADFLTLLDDKAYENSILASFRKEQTIWMSALLVISSGTTIWVATIVLLVVAYVILRRRRRELYREDHDLHGEEDEREEYLEGFDDPAAEFDVMAEERADDWKR